MRNYLRRLETLLMAGSYLEANARKYAQQCLEDYLRIGREARKTRELRKGDQNRKQKRQRLRM